MTAKLIRHDPAGFPMNQLKVGQMAEVVRTGDIVLCCAPYTGGSDHASKTYQIVGSCDRYRDPSHEPVRLLTGQVTLNLGDQGFGPEQS